MQLQRLSWIVTNAVIPLTKLYFKAKKKKKNPINVSNFNFLHEGKINIAWQVRIFSDVVLHPNDAKPNLSLSYKLV